MKCCIADFNVEFKNTTSYIEKKLEDFITQNSPEITFELDENDIKLEKSLIDYPTNENLLQFAAFHRKFIEWLPFNNALFLHASVIDVDGIGVAFAAHSGIGKTTHTLLWRELLDDKMTIVNGDKPVIRFFEDKKYPFAYGAPWCGKEHFGTTGKVALKHICFIQRGEKNVCEPIKPNDALDLIFNQVYIPKNNQIAVYNTLSLIDRLLNVCKLWRITCKPNIEAAQIAYNTIFKEKYNET